MLLCIMLFESRGLWQHSRLGYLEFEFVTLQVPSNPDLRLLVYTANPATLELLLAANQRGQAQELYAGGR